MANLYFITALVLFASLQQIEAQQRATVRLTRNGVTRQWFASTTSSDPIPSNVISTSGSASNPIFPISGEGIVMHTENIDRSYFVL